MVCNFDRQPGGEIKEYEPLSEAMITAIPQTHASRRGVPLWRKQSGVDCAPVVEAQDEEDGGEQVLEENEASFDDLEIEYQVAVAMMTLAKSRSEPSETFLSETSVIWREQGPARQTRSEISLRARGATGPLERR